MSISKHTLEIMQKQFDLDCNLGQAHKIKDDMWIAPTAVLPGSRVIDKLDPFFRVIIFMGKAYVMADESTIPGWEEILKDYPAEWFFNYSRLRKIDRILNEYDREIVDTHIYFLPDADAKVIAEPGGLRWFDESDIASSKDINPFHNAWPYSPTQPDVIGVGMPMEKTDATDTTSAPSESRTLGELSVTDMAALAGASLDGKYVKQIGIDVLPKYRGHGYASLLVSILKQRIMQEEYIPFYGTAESHAISRMTGVRAGFLPAFAELFVGIRSESTSMYFQQTQQHPCC
ncbi:MAG: hypothetical protein IK123_00565 [Lachnospiraceae bacterium]|nr:hypothetical protein [Lachnospiraceae bacterium]